ncbi:MAG: hypothetical protein H6740_23470 [Alphaproteobacteria bacterium]|nr:hypothetical protein [Alphaproteobacteria bacterium]
MRHLALLSLLAASPALADDIDLDDIDINLDDLDLGDGGGSDSLTYTGGLTERKAGIGEDKPVTISHTQGAITVNCSDGDTLSARVDFVIEGSDKGKMEALGKSIGLAAWGDANGGGAKVRMNSWGSGISSVNAPLMVTAPKRSRITVTGGPQGVSVTNCTNDVKVTAAGGIYVEGAYNGFTVRSSKGDVKVEIEAGAVIAKTSSAISDTGSATLIMPDNPSNQLVATGNEVAVAPLVTGKNTPTSVIGEMGNGGAKITLSAPKGKVKVETR